MMTAPLYVPAPIWPENELREFCKLILRAFPGARITVVERGQGPEERQERPPGLAA